MTTRTYKLHVLEGQIETIYIAEYPDRILILDGGCRCDVRRIKNFIVGNLDRSMEDVKLAVVSHIHPDHSGGAPILRRKYRIPIAAPKGIDSWYTGITGWFQHLIDFMFLWSVVIVKGQPFKRMWYPRVLRPDYFLDDGDRLPFFPDWKIIAAPGHTAHHAVLYNVKDRTLYTGDLILRSGSSWHLPFSVTMPRAQKESLEKISRLKIRKLLLAHGGVQERHPAGLFRSLVPGLAKKPPRSWMLLRPLTMLAPEIRRKKERSDV